jgi:hypothetical protein
MKELWTENLMERFSGFAREAESEVLILSPFIKVQALESMLGRISQKKAAVITRWRTADIVSEACDLEIFELLSSLHIPLMVHRQLHMKGLVRDQRELLLSTANITAAGLGVGPISNIECATTVALQDGDRRWIAQIQRESTVVTRAQYEAFRAHVQNQEPRVAAGVEEFHFSPDPIRTGFSVYELPCTETPRHLLENLHALENGRGFLHAEGIVRDAVSFGLTLEFESSANTLVLLRHNFFAKPIIRALIQFVASQRYFGEVKRWIRQECCDADILTNAELIQRVRSVFNWLVELSDGGFTVRRPNFSECLIRL